MECCCWQLGLIKQLHTAQLPAIEITMPIMAVINRLLTGPGESAHLRYTPTSLDQPVVFWLVVVLLEGMLHLAQPALSDLAQHQVYMGCCQC